MSDLKPNQILEHIKSDFKDDISDAIKLYSQSPYLLDPILKESISLLAVRYVETGNVADLHTIYLFCITRGFKVIGQYFPSELQYLTKVKELIKNEKENGISKDWKAQYALLLWLSALVLVPFDLTCIQDHLFSDLYEISTRFLEYSGPQRDASAYLMARLLTRGITTPSNGMNPNLTTERLIEGFVSENRELIDPQQSTSNHVDLRSIGVMQTLAIMLDRSLPILPHCMTSIIESAAELQQNNSETRLWYYNHTVMATLWTKVVGRMGLQDIENLGEFAVTECINLLDHQSTKVRYSAAKYLARLTRKLDSRGDEEVADEIVWMVLRTLEGSRNMELSSSAYWNGSLIFLAELIRERRKIVMVTEEEEAMTLLVTKILNFTGLHFIQHTVNGQIGTNVRDAACYVCWSLFRYVNESMIPGHLQEMLFSSIIQLSCVDCDVSIRRAASAVLQEGLGRLKNPQLPKSRYGKMDLLGEIGYRSVNSIEYCYESLIPKFCENSPEQEPEMKLFKLSQSPNIIELLIHHGLDNSNIKFRRLAAKCLSKIVQPDTLNYTVDKLIDNKLLDSSGKMLALGHINEKQSGYREDDVINLLHMGPDQSPDVMESSISMLHLVPYDICAEFLDASIVDNTPEDNKNIVDELQRVGVILKTNADDKHALVNKFSVFFDKNITRHYLFCVFLIAISDETNEQAYNLIKKAAGSVNPRIRSLVASRLRLDGEDNTLIEKYLSDYTIDKRGEVGAWVRESMLKRLVEHQSDTSDIVFKDSNILCSIWRMATETRTGLRNMSFQILANLHMFASTITDTDSSPYFYQLLSNCPHQFRKVFALSFSSLLAISDNTSCNALDALLQYLHSSDDSLWILTDIMSINRVSLGRAICVLRTLQQLIINGYIFVQSQRQRVLAIAYNTTLEARINTTLLHCAIDILQYFAPSHEKASLRLSSMVKTHKIGEIRQRCADALFELGCVDQILINTDWTVSVPDIDKNYHFKF